MEKVGVEISKSCVSNQCIVGGNEPKIGDGLTKVGDFELHNCKHPINQRRDAGGDQFFCNVCEMYVRIKQ